MDALLVDLYELTMGESYVREGIAERTATFELFCRRLPSGWGYLVAAGIAAVIYYAISDRSRRLDDVDGEAIAVASNH